MWSSGLTASFISSIVVIVRDLSIVPGDSQIFHHARCFIDSDSWICLTKVSLSCLENQSWSRFSKKWPLPALDPNCLARQAKILFPRPPFLRSSHSIFEGSMALKVKSALSRMGTLDKDA